MKFVYFISGRLYRERRQSETMSSPMLRISIAAVALSIAVMLVSLSVLFGFKREIIDKITGFTAHIHLVNFDINQTFDASPIDLNSPGLKSIENNKNIVKKQRFATKPAIARVQNNLQAVVLKGIGEDYDTTFLSKYLIDGKIPYYTDKTISNDVVISERLAKKLNITLGDKLPAYFMQKPIRFRNFQVAGIYRTYMEMYDDNFIIVDLKHIQRLNGWSDSQVSGIELFVSDFSKVDEIADEIRYETALSFDESNSIISVKTVKEIFMQVFDWLNMQNVNVYVIMILMILVSATNMITGLLILILERIRFIGVLKTLGADNKRIKQIFILRSMQIVGKGLIIGNIIALVLILSQHYLKIITLNPENYYLSYVPTEVSIVWWLIINLAAFVTIVSFMILPVRYITTIRVSEIVKSE